MKTQAEWENVFDGTDSCVTPVLQLSSEDTRPIARLSDSPGLPIEMKASLLESGNGGEEVLQEWVGWLKNRDYEIDDQGVVALSCASKL